MPRPRSECQTLTVGQLARRWGVSAARIRQLVQGGRLPGAFTIPLAGHYGATAKIPLATVIQAATQDWVVIPGQQAGPRPRRRRGDTGPALKHFAPLANDPPGGGSPAGARG